MWQRSWFVLITYWTLPAFGHYRLQGVSDVGAGNKAAWNTKQGGKELYGSWCISNVNIFFRKTATLKVKRTCKTFAIVESKLRNFHYSSWEIQVRFLGNLHFFWHWLSWRSNVLYNTKTKILVNIKNSTKMVIKITFQDFFRIHILVKNN